MGQLISLSCSPNCQHFDLALVNLTAVVLWSLISVITVPAHRNREKQGWKEPQQVS